MCAFPSNHGIATESDPLLPRPTRFTDSSSVIDNRGSTARDFYTAERNFLGWLRLSLALMMTGAATLADFNGDGGNSHSSFPSGTILSLLHRSLVSAAGLIGKEAIGLFVFFLSIFMALASLSVFSYTHWQLATLRRPLRWSDTLLSSVTFAAMGSALALGVAILTNHAASCH